MTTYQKGEIAKHGEELAADYLQTRGYKIVERNWRLGKRGEIDIVAEKDGILSFVEVKTRSSEDTDQGFEAISKSKRRKIIMLARCYLAISSPWDQPATLDVILVNCTDVNEDQVMHVPDAFWA